MRRIVPFVVYLGLLDFSLATAVPSVDGRCSKPFRVQFFGDVYISDKYPAPIDSLFSGVSQLLKSADYNIVNLEGVISKHAERAFPNMPFSLKMNPNTAAVLKKQGVSHVTRANNHSMDFGLVGLLDTNAALSDNDIKWTGVGNTVVEAMSPMMIERDGFKLGILAFTTTLPKEAWASSTSPGVAYPTPERLRESIKSLKKQVDYVIVTFHWGEERSRTVRPHQVSLAEIAIMAGADSVVGHHAHVAQNIVKSAEKWIFYGLGNFVFTSRSPHADVGLAARYEFCPSQKKSQIYQIAEVNGIALDTLNTRNNFTTKPITLSNLLKKAKSYFTDELFDSEMVFKEE